MGNYGDLTGKKFNRLLIIKPIWFNVKNNKRQKKWVCVCECGKEKVLLTYDLISGKVKSCGCYSSDVTRKRMTGNSNPFWKGGTKKTRRGYIVINHGINRGKLEHRHIYETHHNVKLKPHQNVHHINGDKTDNRIENLELWDSAQPYGQRVEDKIKFYFQLVQEYKDHPEYKHLFI